MTLLATRRCNHACLGRCRMTARFCLLLSVWHLSNHPFPADRAKTSLCAGRQHLLKSVSPTNSLLKSNRLHLKKFFHHRNDIRKFKFNRLWPHNCTCVSCPVFLHVINQCLAITWQWPLLCLAPSEAQAPAEPI